MDVRRDEPAADRAERQEAANGAGFLRREQAETLKRKCDDLVSVALSDHDRNSSGSARKPSNSRPMLSHA
jgi:hypothetical protein